MSVEKDLSSIFCQPLLAKKFRKIKKWSNKKKYTIKFGRVDQCDYDLKEIVVNRNQKDINIIYSALHECGHVILGSKKSYHKKFKSVVKADIDGRHSRSNIYRYKKLKEEIDAWERGYKLSKKLKLDINKDEYDVYASKYVNTYIKNL